MSSAQGNPWLKFFPTDWRADPALRMCSMAARGLWIEMIGIMHEAIPRGHLLVKGKPLTDERLAMMAGCSPKECSRLLSELEENGVFSRKKTGVIFSRRMVADEMKARKNRANGRKGGNPTLLGSDGYETEKEAPVNPPLKGHDKAQMPDARVQTKELPPPPLDPAPTRAAQPPLVVVADQPDNPSFRERLLVAMGHDPTGMTATGKIVGSPKDMLEVIAWKNLGLDETTILALVTHITAEKRDGPPTTFRYFSQAMARHAAAIKANPLAPVSAAPLPPAKRGWAPPKPFKIEPPRDKRATPEGMKAIEEMVAELRQKAAKGTKR